MGDIERNYMRDINDQKFINKYNFFFGKLITTKCDKRLWTILALIFKSSKSWDERKDLDFKIPKWTTTRTSY